MVKLSIITVCYNSAETIEDTIKSVISQKNNQIEYIIVDGKSTDGTIDIVENYRDTIDKFISEKDEGISDAFNKGIMLAEGEYIGIINSDDILLPNAINCLLKDLEKGTDVVYGNGIRLYKNGKCKPYLSDSNPLTLHRDMTFCHPATFIRREAYAKYGSFSTEYKCVMDRELLLRFLNNGATFAYTDNYYAVYRMGGMSDKSYFKYVLAENYRIEMADKVSRIVGIARYITRGLIYGLVMFRALLKVDYKLMDYQNFLKLYMG